MASIGGRAGRSTGRGWGSGNGQRSHGSGWISGFDRAKQKIQEWEAKQKQQQAQQTSTPPPAPTAAPINSSTMRIGINPNIEDANNAANQTQQENQDAQQQTDNKNSSNSDSNIGGKRSYNELLIKRKRTRSSLATPGGNTSTGLNL